MSSLDAPAGRGIRRSRSRRLALAGVGLVSALVLGGCTAASDDAGADDEPGPASTSATATPTPTPTPTATGGVKQLPANPVFDYQLGGGYEPPKGVTVVVRDSTDSPAEGLYNVCYVNAFQSQPDATWPDVLVVHDAKGEPLADAGWPDEYILDISTDDNRQAIVERQAETIAGCAAAGFDAVEFDNLDSYTRAKGAFGLEAAVTFATSLAAYAHEVGLAVGQKNTPELGDRGATEIGFDFAVSEQCALFDECAAYTGPYGDKVLDIEYADDLRGTFDEICANPATPRSVILRDHDLVPKGEEGYVYERC
ncbi:endo alpha-1,4 polygalactosaminidase [Herbiconiux sp. KACC 21604]|uniref:endo alpha-1,4 polygalactosaminidase n=1 Tax=unclassified Herbiconiux TaxID=2618217 RepID=UPI001491E701|nr:endo alpha-1,4 polygalactosaminidase [Herbiconiux sp. SALV-R1]QJU52266.1 endo alpha-1,4 polygalactosaminidase [Herbiconiux sp. SALV-R1]WPO87113.1 endo alpha-1,4 polygalactosaminidase [Herbiconiux sp. KACC 21604]